MSVKVVTIDGGGIRGLIPCLILHEIETRCGRPTSKLFDMAGGTSTGAIIVAALGVQDSQHKPRFTAQEVFNLYLTYGVKVFEPNFLHKVMTFHGLTGPRYRNQPLKDIINRYCAEVSLSQLGFKTVITAYDIEKRSPFFFKSYKAARKAKYDFKLTDALLAATAAPTYFEPIKISNSDASNQFALVDGGIFANNPSMATFVEALKLHPEEDITMISLGTGMRDQPYLFSRARGWGILEWARPVLNAVFDGVSDSTDYQLNRIMNSMSYRKYIRLQPELKLASTDLDDASDSNLGMLVGEAEQYIKENTGLIDAVCEMLV